MAGEFFFTNTLCIVTLYRSDLQVALGEMAKKGTLCSAALIVSRPRCQAALSAGAVAAASEFARECVNGPASRIMHSAPTPFCARELFTHYNLIRTNNRSQMHPLLTDLPLFPFTVGSATVGVGAGPGCRNMYGWDAYSRSHAGKTRHSFLSG
eukprot:1296463-Rhodomonas_salina.3